jgi:hypothetical protein
MLADTDYVVAMKPTTGGNVVLTYCSVDNESYRRFLAGRNFARASRSSGAFSATNTQVPIIGVRISQVLNRT